MIALIVSPTWNQFHASSPQLNLINSKPHPSFVKFIVTPDGLASEETRATINTCEAVIVDYNNSYAMDFYTGGLKFLIWGDEHCHNMEEKAATEALYAKYDYILTGAPFSPPKSDKYFYINEESRQKRLFFPHCVPDARPEALEWDKRIPRAILPSNVCRFVYSFRWKCWQLASDGAPIDALPHFVKVHEDFFKLLGTYRYAITCNSQGWLNYTVAKYFEMPWMGSVLIAPPPLETERRLLGFESGKNAILTEDYRDVLRVIEGKFTKCDSHEEISKAGVALMQRYHTATARLKYIAELVRWAQTRRSGGGKLALVDSADIFYRCKEAANGH